MSDFFGDVIRFHRAIGHPVGTTPMIPNADRLALRVQLIREEVVKELLPALAMGDLVAIADGIVDSMVVILGTAAELGIDPGPVWDEVHRSLMAKVGGPVRADGKQLKPPGWQPPDVAGVLWRQGPIGGDS